MLPQPPKLLGEASGGCGEVALGAGSAHALPPHTSEPPIEPIGIELVTGAGCALAWVRLKGELRDAGAACTGAGADEDDEKSKRSFMAEEAGAAGLEGAAEDVKSPKPPKPVCAGAALGEDMAAGLASKKLPPLRPEKELVCCGGGDLRLDMPPRPEKASATGGLLGLEMLEKLRLLKASLKFDWAGCWCWVICDPEDIVGECIDPNELEWLCDICCVCCGRGAVA